MSMRDELVREFSRQAGGNGVDAEYWADRILPIIERALAAERAATIEECASAANDQAAIAQIAAEKRYGKPAGDLSEDEDHFLHEAAMAEEVARTILALPRNRSALAEALAQARREQRDVIETAWVNVKAARESLPMIADNETASRFMADAAGILSAAIQAQED